MKKSYRKPQEGDVFILQPIKDKFYFGKVIQTNLESADSFINGMMLISYMTIAPLKKGFL